MYGAGPAGGDDEARPLLSPMTAGFPGLPPLAPALKITTDGKFDEFDAAIVLMPESTAALDEVVYDRANHAHHHHHESPL